MQILKQKESNMCYYCVFITFSLSLSWTQTLFCSTEARSLKLIVEFIGRSLVVVYLPIVLWNHRFANITADYLTTKKNIINIGIVRFKHRRWRRRGRPFTVRLIGLLVPADRPSWKIWNITVRYSLEGNFFKEQQFNVLASSGYRSCRQQEHEQHAQNNLQQ